MLFEFLFAQQNHAHHRHEQEHGDDFKRQRVLREQKFAERVGFAFECGSGLIGLDGRERLHKNADDDADGNQAGGEAKEFNFASLLFLQVEQHDDENEQHDDRAGVDENLHRREEKCVEQQEQTGHRDDRQHEKHRARDRIAAKRIRDDENGAQQRQRREDVKENIFHRAAADQIVDLFHC